MSEIDEFFIKHEIIKLKLIEQVIENPSAKLPPARVIAKENGVSELTVKKVEKELATKGYLKSNKKGGTRASIKFAKQQIAAFITAKETFRGIVENLLKEGFSSEDVMALIYDVLSKIKDISSNLIYTERDENIAIFAKRELEDALQLKIVFKPYETLRVELSNRMLHNKIIAVPFFCSPPLEELSYDGVKIVPLRAKHPLEGFSQAKDIPFNSRVFYIAASKMDKENSISIYQDILRRKFKLYIYTQDEIIANKHLLGFADIVVGYKWIIRANSYIFKQVRRVVEVDRIDDKEGVKLLSYYIERMLEEQSGTDRR